jgi:preprotein translocase SecE subunit
MKLLNYIKDTRAELAHVNWPTSRQATIYTVAVIVIAIVVAAYMGLFDYAFTRGLDYLIKNF